jgi:FkbM family methyltransferase
MHNQDVFYHYNSSFDATSAIKKHAVPNLKSTRGFLTNFLGVKIRPEFLPDILGDMDGKIEPIPDPANWHADISEWAAALRSIDVTFRKNFVMAELGCGWGCWMNNTGVAARNAGHKVHLIGVEGDQGHCNFARKCLSDNGFASDEFVIHNGIAGAEEGFALFPIQDHAGTNWGLAPIFNAGPELVVECTKNGTHSKLKTYSLSDVFKNHDLINLLHIDIQGGEFTLIEKSIGLISSKVNYLVIGTHSRQIEGNLHKLLLESNWELEIERPAILQLTPTGPVTIVDGLQGWINKKFNKAIPEKDIIYHKGFSSHEVSHIWTLGTESIIQIKLEANHNLKGIIFDAGGLICAARKEQATDVYLNDNKVATWNFNSEHNDMPRLISIDTHENLLQFKFVTPNPISPSSIGISGDKRILGLKIKSIKTVTQQKD